MFVEEFLRSLHAIHDIAIFTPENHSFHSSQQFYSSPNSCSTSPTRLSDMSNHMNSHKQLQDEHVLFVWEYFRKSYSFPSTPNIHSSPPNIHSLRLDYANQLKPADVVGTFDKSIPKIKWSVTRTPTSTTDSNQSQNTFLVRDTLSKNVDPKLEADLSAIYESATNF